LHVNGKPLNADVDRYIVVPLQVPRMVGPVVLGCRAVVTYQGKSVEAVVGDLGPRTRLGEMSIACAEALGIDSNPNTGGVDTPTVHYALWPGVAAQGYVLQPS
jgi:hypothetical protein